MKAKETAAAAEVQLPNHITGYLVFTDSTIAGSRARYAGRDASSITDIARLETVIREQVMMLRLEREGVKQEIVGSLARNRLRLDAERPVQRR